MGRWGRQLPLQVHALMLLLCGLRLCAQVQELYANKEKELQTERDEQLKAQDAALAQQVSLDDCGSLEQLSSSKRALHRTVFVIMLDVDMAAKSVELLSQMITLLVQACSSVPSSVLRLVADLHASRRGGDRAGESGWFSHWTWVRSLTTGTIEEGRHSEHSVC